MEKKKSTGLYVALGMLGVLAFVVIVLVGILIFKGFSGREEDGLKEPDVVEADERDSSLSGGNMTYVVDGYQFTVPGEYSCIYYDSVGTVVYQDDVFQMRIAVMENSYEEFMQNPDALTQKSLDAGGIILQDVKETEYEGKKYAYYRVDLSGEECFVVYTGAPEENNHIAGQIALEQDNLQDEEMLKVFASVTATAVATDEPDSTMEDISELISAKARYEAYGEVKKESTLQHDDLKVTYKVPDGFFSADMDENSDYVVERFRTGDPYIDVNCFLFNNEDFANAESYIDASANEGYTLETMEIEGNTFYVVIEKYQYDDSEYQDIYAGCNLENGFYLVKAQVIDEGVDLNPDVIREFLNIQVN